MRVTIALRYSSRAMSSMHKTPRVAALERLIQQYEKCRSELTQLDQHIRNGASGEELDDVLELNAQSIESATRSLHVAYARLEREQTRTAVNATRSASPFARFSAAI